LNSLQPCSVGGIQFTAIVGKIAGYFLIHTYFIFGLEIDYRDPYRHAIRELEEYTSPRKETPQLQR